jgi:hypothetical protein
MTAKITKLLDKYWEGDTSLEEEHEIKQYFLSDNIDKQHLQYKGLFVFFNQQSTIQTTLVADIDALLEKYWEAETSEKEEAILKAYFKSNYIDQKHEAFVGLFDFYDKRSQIRTTSTTDIDALLNKYWEGETTEKEEKVLKAYFKSGQIEEAHLPFADLFDFFETQQQITYPTKVIPMQPRDEQAHIEKKSNVRVISIFSRVAAVAIFILGSIFIFNNINNVAQSNSTNVYVVEDPEEALRITREALAMVSTKFRESQESLKEINSIDQITLFKSE